MSHDLLGTPLETITVHRDGKKLYLECSKSVSLELAEAFSFFVPNYLHMPKYLEGTWDGKIRLFSTYNNSMAVGLWHRLKEWAAENRYELRLTFEWPAPVASRHQVASYMTEYLRPMDGGERITPYDFQIDSVLAALNERNMLLLSPTSSGKSFIMYALTRWWLERHKDPYILIIEPRKGLIEQIFTEFGNFSSANQWIVANHVHKLYQGQAKRTEKRVLLSTWQSIQKEGPAFFKRFTHVIVDECHEARGPVVRSVIERCVNAEATIGLTGSLDGKHVNEITLNSVFGRTVSFVTTKDLIDRKIVADLSIKILMLEHGEDSKRIVGGGGAMPALDGIQEVDWLSGHAKRNRFIVNLATRTEGNNLILYQLVEKHGKPLYEALKAATDRPVYFIHGAVDVKERERVRKIMEKETNAIVLASYGTFSTGVSIKAINNIVFASPFKGQIRLLQSIGRGLRRSKTKTSVTLYDVADDLRHGNRKNATYVQLMERIRIYKKQQFPYTTYPIKLGQ